MSKHEDAHFDKITNISLKAYDRDVFDKQGIYSIAKICSNPFVTK